METNRHSRSKDTRFEWYRLKKKRFFKNLRKMNPKLVVAIKEIRNISSTKGPRRIVLLFFSGGRLQLLLITGHSQFPIVAHIP